MSGNGYRSFFEIQLRPWKSTQSRREPSFFRMKRTGAPWGDREGRMNPVARFSSMNLRRAASSSWDNE